MKSTWIVAATLVMSATLVGAQSTPPTPTATPPIVGMNVDTQAPSQPMTMPPGLNMPPGAVPMPMPQQQMPSAYPSAGGMNRPANVPTNVRSYNPQSGQPGGLPPGVAPSLQPGMPSNMPSSIPANGAYGAPPPFNPNFQNQNMGGDSTARSEIVAVLPPAQRPPETRAVLRTSVGDITVRLDRVNAPMTVDYFAGIAKGEVDFTDIKTSKPVKRPFYNGLIFHRVVKNTLIQTGDPFGNGRGNSGRTIPDEIRPSMKFDRPGLVAMAPMRESTGTKVAQGTNSSQFFITLREMPEWNGQYTIFGEVEDGLDVVQKIANSKVGPTERPIKRIYLVAVDILENAK